MVAVATQNNTVITVTPRQSYGSRTAGVSYTVTLNQGQAYALMSTDVGSNGNGANEISGTRMTSTVPFVAYSNNACAGPGYPGSCDQATSTLFPTSQWGTSFVLPRFINANAASPVRVLANQNGTTVKVNGTLVATLAAGQFYSTQTAASGNTGLSIVTNKPVEVAEFMVYGGTNLGDPDQLIVPPYQQFLTSYTVATPGTNFVSNWINIAIPTASIPSFRLDGAAVSSSQFAVVAGTTFSVAQLSISTGTHTLVADQPFGAFVYGVNNYNSYSYAGGSALSPIASVLNIAITGSSALARVTGYQACFAVLVSDSNSNPVSGVRVDLTATGANPTATGYSVTDSDGTATVCYTGANVGTDAVTLTSATSSTTGSVVWSLPVIAINGGASVSTNNRTRPITGTTTAITGSAVTVTVAGQTLTTTVQAGGTWTVTPTSIADGSYTVTASSGGASATQSLTIDTVAPVIAINGGSPRYVATHTPTIAGTTDASAGSTVTVTVAGQTLTATVQAGGTWSVTPASIADGTYPVTASVSDLAGNTATAGQSLVVDTVAPVIAINGGSPRYVATHTPTIAGTTDASAGSTVTVTVAGQTLTATVQAGGTWSVTPASIADGTYPVTASVSDLAGNTATAGQSLVVDTVAPVIAINGGSPRYVATHTPTIAGTTDASAGSTVTVTVAGQTLTATVQAGGTWSVTPASVADGTYPVTASVSDLAGNTATAGQSLVVDTVAPVIAINGGSPRYVATHTPTIAGTTDASAGSTVTVTVAGQTLTATVQAGGTWSVTPASVADGTYPVTASVSDLAGNTATAGQSLVVDTVAPVIAINGGSPRYVATHTPTIAGTTDASAGSTVTVTVAGQTLTATVQAGGTWSVTPASVADGTYPVTASVSDLAGNTATANQSLIVDTVAPLIAIDGGPAITVYTATPTISGTTDAAVGSTVTVTVGGQILTASVQSGGLWSVVAPSLGPRSYSVTAAVTDAAGNNSVATQQLTVDLTAPGIVVTSPTTLSTTTGQRLVGTTDAAPGSSVSVIVGTRVLSTVVRADGTWVVNLPTLALGATAIRVLVTDAHGFVSELTLAVTTINSTTLAATGSSPAEPFGVAVILLLSGAFALILGRRRAQS